MEGMEIRCFLSLFCTVKITPRLHLWAEFDVPFISLKGTWTTVYTKKCTYVYIEMRIMCKYSSPSHFLCVKFTQQRKIFFISHSLLPIMHFPLQNFYIQNIFSTYHETSGNNKMCLVQKSQRHKKWHIWGFFAYTQKKKNISIMFMCRHLLFFSLFLYFLIF